MPASRRVSGWRVSAGQVTVTLALLSNRTRAGSDSPGRDGHMPNQPMSAESPIGIWVQPSGRGGLTEAGQVRHDDAMPVGQLRQHRRPVGTTASTPPCTSTSGVPAPACRCHAHRADTSDPTRPRSADHDPRRASPRRTGSLWLATTPIACAALPSSTNSPVTPTTRTAKRWTCRTSLPHSSPCREGGR